MKKRRMLFEEEDFDDPILDMDIGRKTEEPGEKQETYRKSADIVPFFGKEEDEEFRPPTQFVPEESIKLGNQGNLSLSLAERADFFGMCKPILWGNEDENLFGEMLRGLVLEFLPENEFHLHLLRNIAEAQWGIERATLYKKGIFDNNTDRPGTHRMPAGTEMGINYNKVTRTMTSQLKTAISIYNQLKDR